MRIRDCHILRNTVGKIRIWMYIDIDSKDSTYFYQTILYMSLSQGECGIVWEINENNTQILPSRS